MSVHDEPRSSVDRVVDNLSAHVWQLICAGHVDAAMVLLRGSLDEFLEAQRRDASAVVRWQPPALKRRPIPMPAGPAVVEVVEGQVVNRPDPGVPLFEPQPATKKSGKRRPAMTLGRR